MRRPRAILVAFLSILVFAALPAQATRSLPSLGESYKTAGRTRTHLQLPMKLVYRVKIELANPPDIIFFTRFRPEDHPNWGIGGGSEATTYGEIEVGPTTLERLEVAGR